jgi:hypothetical protein
MHRSELARTLRYAIVATAFLASTLAPTLSASAKTAALNVDLPAPNTIVANGEMLEIGGWTSGDRIDVYLDGPAGFGEGIGSAAVYTARPDVALATGDHAMADAGFNLAWQPMDLTAGPHTLYVYSLVDGSWIFHTVPIIGLGNAFVQADSSSNGRDEASFDVAPSVSNEAAPTAAE